MLGSKYRQLITVPTLSYLSFNSVGNNQDKGLITMKLRHIKQSIYHRQQQNSSKTTANNSLIRVTEKQREVRRQRLFKLQLKEVNNCYIDESIVKQAKLEWFKRGYSKQLFISLGINKVLIILNDC